MTVNDLIKFLVQAAATTAIALMLISLVAILCQFPGTIYVQLGTSGGTLRIEGRPQAEKPQNPDQSTVTGEFQ